MDIATKRKRVRRLRALCDCYFNDRTTRWSRLLPASMRQYRYKDKTLSERELYQKCKTIADSIDQSNRTDKKIQIPQDRSVYLRPLERIYENSPFFDLIIHGSYADKTFTAASDVDDLIILRPAIFDDLSHFRQAKRTLDKLGRWYQHTDPLQHHGHWIITAYELDCFDESVLPIAALRSAVSIGKSLELDVSVTDDTAVENRRQIILDGLLSTVEEYGSDFIAGRCNLFRLKTLISATALIPALLFQIKGEAISKREAIERADEVLDTSALSLIRWTTTVRKQWSYLPTYWMTSLLRGLSFIFPNRKMV